MPYLAAFNWVWLVCAAVVGLGMGWIAVVQRGGLSTTTMRRIGVLLGALVLAAAFRLVPGRAGYVLDLGLTMFGAYILGCAIGSWLRYLVVSRPAAPT